MAFPDGAVAESVSAVLTEAQIAEVKALAGVDVDSKLFTYFRGVLDGKVVGYAVIDSRVVRTEPEVFMAVLKPDGVVDRVVMLAFYEPPEYKPPDRWLQQFEGRRLDSGAWRVGGDIHGLSGSTLTAHAIRDSLRKIAALHKVVMSPASDHGR
jgi:hypothetical protein